MTDRTAMLRAICENPAEDAVRLAFADFLEENGERERAEFIRVQMELAKMGGLLGGSRWLECHLRKDWLEGRERPLLRRYGNAWVPKPLRLSEYEWLGTTYSERMLSDGTHTVLEILRKRSCKFFRGFISSITCTFPDLLAHGATLFGENPIEKVTVVGARPQFAAGHYWWQLVGREDNQLPHTIPSDLWELVEYASLFSNGRSLPRHEAESNALNWLSSLCVSYGRHAANLPPLVTQATPGGMVSGDE